MKLYYSPGACSLSPHIVLHELGLDFELEKVDIRAGKTEHGVDFETINPNGYVPALRLDGGQILTEGPAIVQYLADLNPAAGLAPANGTLERYQLQEWLNFISTELHKQFTPFFHPKGTADWKAVALDMIRMRFAALGKTLERRYYLLGERFTVADAYLFTVQSWTPHIGLNLAEWPRLQEYQLRIAERPAVLKAMEAEGLLTKA